MKQLRTLVSGILVLACTAFMVHAQSSVTQDADRLVAQRKYLSAYHLLEQADPDSRDPQITISRTHILTSFFTKSFSHLIFGLADLDHGEDLDSIRTADSGSYSMFMYRPDSVLTLLLQTHPDNGGLHLALGNFYYTVWQIYGDQWLVSDSALADGSEAELFAALRLGVRDNNTYSRLGYLALDRQDYGISAGYYRTAIDSGSIDISDYYNVAVCDLYQDKFTEGISYARYSYERYEDSAQKGDAAHLLGALFMSMASYDSAIRYFKISLGLDSSNAYSYAKLVSVYCLSGRTAEAIRQAEDYFAMLPGQSTLNDIVHAFHDAKQDDGLRTWFKQMKGTYAKDNETSGGLRLVEAQYYLSLGERSTAKKLLNESRSYFQQVYEPADEVFPFIEQLLNDAK